MQFPGMENIKSFKHLKCEKDIEKLNLYLSDKSYLLNYVLSSIDFEIFNCLKTSPDSTKYPNAARWYHHISSYKNDCEYINLCRNKQDLTALTKETEVRIIILISLIHLYIIYI